MEIKDEVVRKKKTQKRNQRMRRIFIEKSCVISCHDEYKMCSETEKPLLQVGYIRTELGAGEVENPFACVYSIRLMSTFSCCSSL